MQQHSLRSIVTTATVGTVIEWYDFFIFRKHAWQGSYLS